MDLPIQQATNQLFNLATFSALMNPAVQGAVKKGQERTAAIKNVKQKEKALNTALSAMEKGKYPGMKDPTYQEEVTKGLQADLASAQEELFNISPSEETAQPVIERKFVEAANEAGRKSSEQIFPEPGDPEWIEGVEAEAAKRQRAEQFESDVKAILHPQEQVQQKMAQKGMEQVKQRTQRRSFMKYLKENPQTANLGPGALKQIQSGLTKQEKTKMMNEYYGGKK